MKKEKIELEFIINSSPNVLYNFLKNPSELQEWFADKVDYNTVSKVYTFEWEEVKEKAKLIRKVNRSSVRYKWLQDIEEKNNYYFEFLVKIDEITNEVALIVKDFANPNDKEDLILLWKKQINNLKRRLGN